MAMGKPAIFRQGFIISSIAVLMGVSGCGPTGMGGAGSGTPVATSVEVVERDVEAPDVFDVSEAGLWDGRPSLGGIWVAHPDVKDPERVIIRAKNNGKFVIGALFRRERENAGPRLQLSSDAADALGILAGQPTNVSVIALRRETVSAAPEADAVEKPTEVSDAPLDPVVETAAPAIEATPVVAPEKPAASVTKAPASTSSLSKPYIQIGIFSVEQNAKNTAQSMRQRGIIPLIKEMTLNGKTFWRVIVGPAQSASDLKSLKDKVQKAGFSDAYAVSG